MIPFPAIDPVAVALGPVKIHWYGLAYVVGIGLGWWVLARRAVAPGSAWTRDDVGDVVFFAALGAVLGGRFGYALFYNLAEYLRDPAALLRVWQGGMSFHGGVLGFILALAVYARRRARPFFAVADFVVPVVPIGLFFGRLANFVNQELWGAPSAVPWAVLFTAPAAGGVPRHPSQLYEAALEGGVLFAVLNFVARAKPAHGTVAGVFLVGYGVLRFLVEFVREPDAHIGYLFGTPWVTMGHVLSAPMVAAGMVILTLARARRLG